MRTLIAALTFFLTACAAPRVGQDEGTVQRQVSAVTAEWVDAYNSRDPARITAMYEPDAV